MGVRLAAIEKGIDKTFGIIPPLGPLAETEEFLTLRHVRQASTQLFPQGTLEIILCRYCPRKSIKCHIFHVQKKYSRPAKKETTNRIALEMIRSQIGSTFNLVASQFEHVDRILFAEDVSDFKVLSDIAHTLGTKLTTFNIPLHGFSEYRKAVPFTDSYKLLIGSDPKYVMVLDRDYYPESYLQSVAEELHKTGIELVLTLGKEIENIFLSPKIVQALLPAEWRSEWRAAWNAFLKDQYLDSYGSFITLHEKFLQPRCDTKTVTKTYSPRFNNYWNDATTSHNAVAGKPALQFLRGFCREKCGRNLTHEMLIKAVCEHGALEVRGFVESIFG